MGYLFVLSLACSTAKHAYLPLPAGGIVIDARPNLGDVSCDVEFIFESIYNFFFNLPSIERKLFITHFLK